MHPGMDHLYLTTKVYFEGVLTCLLSKTKSFFFYYEKDPGMMILRKQKRLTVPLC